VQQLLAEAQFIMLAVAAAEYTFPVIQELEVGMAV
jgi:hypothetical protein